MSEPREIGERAFEFAVRVVKLCRAIDGGDNASRVLSRQLIRSGTSIGANIEEGKGSQSRADFRAKYSIALKEARETHCWLRLLRGTGCPGHPELEALIRESDELIRIQTSIIKKLKANP